jgi:2-polyprenyl-6-methoxyphenol hydroxylase-like FAD-dependent oxidoreductase
MAGLLAVAALAPAYDEVTVVERDVLGTEAAPRRGVPQGRHVHVLLSRGAAAIEDVLPGLLSELTGTGGLTVENLNKVHFEVDGHVLCQDDSATSRIHLQSRPFLESHVLARVRRLPNVHVLDGHDVVDLLWDGTGRRVVGASVARRSPPDQRVDIEADLVVVALGRNGRVGAWLAQHGYEEPPQQELRIDLVYASRLVRMDARSVGGCRAVVIGAQSARPTGVALLPQENDTWIVTVEGYAGHHPPTDPDAWLEAAARLAPPAFARALREAEPVTDLHAHRFPSNLWRRYDRLDRFPDGLLVTGDAFCSFNPVYGQGMTIAALEAQRLGDALRRGGDDLGPRFFGLASKAVKAAWDGAVGGDLALPPDIVPGHRPLPVRAVNAYLDRYLEAAEHDAVLALNFFDVTGLDKSAAALFTPRALRQVARSFRPGRRSPVPGAA